MHFTLLLSAAAFVAPTLAGYVLQDDYMEESFYSNFDFNTDPDPTHGFVQYVDETTAHSMKLINTSSTSTVQWGVDTTTKNSAGRASMRLTSKKSYNKGLVVIDVKHMPFGCGTWPAFWMVGPSWPNEGEIDIIEGVHEQATNQMTLHTDNGCTIQKDVEVFTGDALTDNCFVDAADQSANAGCTIKATDTKSYGAGLNNVGGGVYATEWTSNAINIYFFPRGAVPADALGDSPDPSGWGKPASKWTTSGCDIDSHFKNQQIIFDTTFCGDWAGDSWSTSTCASKAATCNDYVLNNPSAFTDAHWAIDALKVYQSNGAASNSTQSASTLPSGKPSATANSTLASATFKVTALPSVQATTLVSVSKLPTSVSSRRLILPSLGLDGAVVSAAGIEGPGTGVASVSTSTELLLPSETASAASYRHHRVHTGWPSIDRVAPPEARATGETEVVATVYKTAFVTVEEPAPTMLPRMLKHAALHRRRAGVHHAGW